MIFPEELHYTKTNEWAKKDGARVTVGITDYAQKEISDVVYVELPKVGQEIGQGKPAAVVESVKAAFDIYAPLTGKVVKINPELEGNPALVNQSCYGDGWFFELEMSQTSQWDGLMTVQTYEAHLKQQTK